MNLMRSEEEILQDVRILSDKEFFKIVVNLVEKDWKDQLPDDSMEILVALCFSVIKDHDLRVKFYKGLQTALEDNGVPENEIDDTIWGAFLNVTKRWGGLLYYIHLSLTTDDQHKARRMLKMASSTTHNYDDLADFIKVVPYEPGQ